MLEERESAQYRCKSIPDMMMVEYRLRSQEVTKVMVNNNNPVGLKTNESLRLRVREAGG